MIRNSIKINLQSRKTVRHKPKWTSLVGQLSVDRPCCLIVHTYFSCFKKVYLVSNCNVSEIVLGRLFAHNYGRKSKFWKLISHVHAKVFYNKINTIKSTRGSVDWACVAHHYLATKLYRKEPKFFKDPNLLLNGDNLRYLYNYSVP